VLSSLKPVLELLFVICNLIFDERRLEESGSEANPRDHKPTKGDEWQELPSGAKISVAQGEKTTHGEVLQPLAHLQVTTIAHMVLLSKSSQTCTTSSEDACSQTSAVET